MILDWLEIRFLRFLIWQAQLELDIANHVGANPVYRSELRAALSGLEADLDRLEVKNRG